MTDPHRVPHRRPPGPLGGALLGIAAGLLVGAVLAYGGRDVGLALAAVVLGLSAVLLAGAPGWRWFGASLLVLAVLAASGLDVLVWRA